MTKYSSFSQHESLLPASEASSSSSGLLKSKFKSSLEKLRRLFNFNATAAQGGGWSRIPNNNNLFDLEAGLGSGDWENEQMLPPNSQSNCKAESFSNNSITSRPARTARKTIEMKRVNKELIDDEVPLIELY